MKKFDHFKKPIENAMVKATFAAWLDLGNSSPLNWSGAETGVRSCLKFAREGFSNPDLLLDPGDCPVSREAAAYALAAKSLNEESDREEALDKLCRLAYSGNKRAQRVLAGFGHLLLGDGLVVPGLDDGRVRVEAAEFYLESGDTQAAAEALSSGGWWGREAYLCGGRILLEEGMVKEAREAFAIGGGLGESGCRGYTVALHGTGRPMSAEDFRVVQAAAERGFRLPLVAAAEALALGVGVDPDPLLASFYRAVAEEEEVETRGGGGKDFFEVIFSWAGKHPEDPIHLLAAKRWAMAISKK